MPANTVVPSDCRISEPAPVATTSGATPKMNASEVIRQVLTVRGWTGGRETVCNIRVDRFLAELKSFEQRNWDGFHLTTSISFVVVTVKLIGSSFKVGFHRVLKEAGILLDRMENDGCPTLFGTPTRP
jgi:hypothetical protein